MNNNDDTFSSSVIIIMMMMMILTHEGKGEVQEAQEHHEVEAIYFCYILVQYNNTNNG